MLAGGDGEGGGSTWAVEDLRLAEHSDFAGEGGLQGCVVCCGPEGWGAEGEVFEGLGQRPQGGGSGGHGCGDGKVRFGREVRIKLSVLEMASGGFGVLACRVTFYEDEV